MINVAIKIRSPGPIYKPNNYWALDAKESIFKNSAGAVIGRQKTDILNQKYGLKEAALVPAPGTYNNLFSEFTGLR